MTPTEARQFLIGNGYATNNAEADAVREKFKGKSYSSQMLYQNSVMTEYVFKTLISDSPIANCTIEDMGKTWS